MITKIRTVLAGMVVALSMPLMSNAATITDMDEFLELGAVIDSFASASLSEVPSPTGLTTSIVGNNLLSGTNFAASDNGGGFSILYGPLPPLAGTETERFATTGIFEVLFEVAAPSALAPSGLFLLEFLYVPPPVALPGIPLVGTATIYQVNEIPLPAGLPLVLTAFGVLWGVRRLRRAT